LYTSAAGGCCCRATLFSTYDACFGRCLIVYTLYSSEKGLSPLALSL